jgi:hypothetical protein
MNYPSINLVKIETAKQSLANSDYIPEKYSLSPRLGPYVKLRISGNGGHSQH